MPWALILSFVWKLLTGNLWAVHRQMEADNVENKVAAESDNAVSKQLHDQWESQG